MRDRQPLPANGALTFGCPRALQSPAGGGIRLFASGKTYRNGINCIRRMLGRSAGLMASWCIGPCGWRMSQEPRSATFRGSGGFAGGATSVRVLIGSADRQPSTLPPGLRSAAPRRRQVWLLGGSSEHRDGTAARGDTALVDIAMNPRAGTGGQRGAGRYITSQAAAAACRVPSQLPKTQGQG